VAIEAAHLGLGESAVSPQAEGASFQDVGEVAPSGSATEGLRAATEAFQRRWIESALARHGGAMAAAAREAGMDRSNFHRLATKLGVTVARARR
jgi:anaerobic nitric oxide reductase transcription regulator